MTFISEISNGQVWNTWHAFLKLKDLGEVQSKRTAERQLLKIMPKIITSQSLLDESGNQPIPDVIDWEINQARKKRKLPLFAQLAYLPNGKPCIHANDARGGRYWVALDMINQSTIFTSLIKLQIYFSKPLIFFPHGKLTAYCRKLKEISNISFGLLGYPAVLKSFPKHKPHHVPQNLKPGQLDQLEAESIFILREAVAEARNPVMLYSVGKDSSVMLHLARKAFFPSFLPFPLLHIDTRWKFREMYLFRDQVAKEYDLNMLVYINPEAIDRNINPFDHGSKLHTEITKTEGLKQALDHYHFDVAFGGARRDEEKSRAKERIFSFRSNTHRWDPKNQRPEPWNLYNAKKREGESIRIFPLSNWTELDIWQYIYRENIPIVPLYFAKERPIIVRNKQIIMVDDTRMRLLPGEKIQSRKIRFRTLGCYPLSGAIESEAETLPEIIIELLDSRSSERQGRTIDSDDLASMEKKKQKGYF